ncbi:MAG: carbohydrate ABC transporter permease [Lachnospiraceae bacterium]|nr:carbohydrate ABC transporter permease [Lachnospiraceae bacterium]
MGAKGKRITVDILKNILAWAVAMLVLVPMALIIITTFKTDKESLGMSLTLPTQWVFTNFSTVIQKGKLGQSFINSLTYAGFATLLTVMSGTMSAYVFSRRRTKGFIAMYMYLVLGMVIPINYVALMKIMQVTHLNNTRLGIILLYAALQTPFTIFLIYGFVSKVPSELDEAAVIDGCGPFSLYFRVVFPLLKPAMITAGVLCFLNTWNEFIMPLYFLNSTTKWPMTLAIYNFFGQFDRSWNLICADVILTCAPVVILYILAQRFIVGGQTAGAVKG